MKEIIERVVCDQHRSERRLAVKRIEFAVFGSTYGKDLCQECLDTFRAEAEHWRKNAEKLRRGTEEEETSQARVVVEVELPDPRQGLEGIEWWQTPKDAHPRTRAAFKHHRQEIAEWAKAPEQVERGITVNQFGKIPRETGFAWLDEVWLPGQSLPPRPGLHVVNGHYAGARA